MKEEKIKQCLIHQLQKARFKESENVEGMIDRQKLQGFSRESTRTDFLSPFLWMKALKNLSLNGLEQKHHLEKPDSVFWLHQEAANAKMYG